MIQQPMPHKGGIRGRIILFGQSGDGVVDLLCHRFAVKFVEVARGGPGKEFGATHAKVLGTQ